MDIFGFFTLRTIIVLFSTAISILIVMLMVNIITVDDAIAILHLSGDSANAFRQIVERMREVFGNIIGIISQLLEKLLSWAGVDVDLTKVQVDVNQAPLTPTNISK